MGAENLIRCTDQGRCARKNVGTFRANYVQHSVAPAVRRDPDGDLEILVSSPIGVFGTHRLEPADAALPSGLVDILVTPFRFTFTCERLQGLLLQLVIGRSALQELSPALFRHMGGRGRLQEILQDC